MYFRIGIICAAGFASGSSYIGFRHAELPKEVRRLELSLSSVADLKQFTRDIDSFADGMYLGKLGRFLKTANNVRWIYAQHARITSEEVRKAFDTFVTILQNVRSTNYFDNQCSPPLGEYIEKDLSPEEIRFVADLYSLEDRSIEQDTEMLNRVTDYEKMFRPIVNLFKHKVASSPMDKSRIQSACFDKNVLRRIATIRTLTPEEFVGLLTTPTGLLADPLSPRFVLAKHVKQIKEILAGSFRQLAAQMRSFDQSRSGLSRDDVGKLIKFVWYYVPAETCRQSSQELWRVETLAEFEAWHKGSLWAAICALNSDADHPYVRGMRERMFSLRSPIVQDAIQFMDSDSGASFQAKRAEVLLSPISSSDSEILRVPALLGKGYKLDYDYSDRVDPNYPAIARAYLEIAGDVNPIQLNYLWNELLKGKYNECQSGDFYSCYNFKDVMVLNPFTLVSSIKRGLCTTLVRPEVAMHLFDTVERCEALEETDPETLIAALLSAMSTGESTTSSIRSAFDQVLPRL